MDYRIKLLVLTHAEDPCVVDLSVYSFQCQLLAKKMEREYILQARD